ncbi:DegT/DnrJ/EryC1/StrS family aminotransferase [Labilibaculum sp. DW002]|uniref:DegT/DnrJ/EryC1/StrS family aminotransferase n=1 Tax=Paralabilibaculum antarcticum TaxID=2912572 RepID=A0ABT5VRP6_9BACT|nr:DegT/DnrJ/EryC1/StrS family aminotransferase [Labilibaculum sp. DW002]MDE5417462.1 DegT/DnrJ/EryC1/StrS family aminotransferase [Labilibaculum sp. DW002]
MEKRKILVTRPQLPPLNEFIPMLEDIWDSRWLTNNGKYHEEFEKALAIFLGVPYVSLFANGTLALMAALQCLRVKGEVITTPYSFVATTHSLWWNGIKPVFVDIDPVYGNLNPDLIEAAITPETTAILPVHVYGNPCKVEAIQNLADIYGLKVIYDAAHAFGVKLKNSSVLNYGDLSILSFHATKVFNTIEGGAIISHDLKTKKRIDFLKNFGIADETTVVAPGINAKMNELQAAYGMLQLKYFDTAIDGRKHITDKYKEGLEGIAGIRFLNEATNVDYNYSYFPIFVDELEFGRSRDDVFEELKKYDIYGRRYFYPLISEFSAYRGLPSAKGLDVAYELSRQIICLPLYPDLADEVVETIVSIILEMSLDETKKIPVKMLHQIKRNK